jgi:hypothetical protein
MSEIEHVHGSVIPAEGVEVTFTNLGKECKAKGDGIHSCYQLIGHHPTKDGKFLKPKGKRKTSAKKRTTKRKTAKK